MTIQMNEYKKKLKENVKILIENNFLKEAKEIISQYEKIVENDIEIFSMKGVIYLLEGDFIEAEKILIDGLLIDITNFDLLYNMAYLYQLMGKNELAIEFYKQALINTNNEFYVNEVYNRLNELRVKISKTNVTDNKKSIKYYCYARKLEIEGIKSDAAIYYGLAYKYSTNFKLRSILESLYKNEKVLYDIFNVAAKLSKRKFIILSSCGWSGIYQRMHHIARALAKFEHEVLYVTPASRVSVNDPIISASDLTKYSLKYYKEVDNVKIFTPLIAVYNENEIASNYVDLVQTLLNLSDNSNKAVIITYMPYQSEIIKLLKGEFIHIYECVDDHLDLEYVFWGNKKDVIWEQELMDNAYAITTTSIALFLQRSIIEGRKNVYLSRNAVNEGDFICNDDFEEPEDLKNIPKPRIVYSGAIYDWFDKDLFYEVVKSNPDKSFVIIGFGNDKILNEECKNLYILGPKKHNELKKYLKHMDIGIIPFKADIDIVINCDAIKHYEYIASGLPVITTYMPEAAMGKPYTFLVNTKQEFNRAIESCLKLKVDKKRIEEFIYENSWNARAGLICKIIDKEISEDERINELKKIGDLIIGVTRKYDNAIFYTLKAIYLSLQDNTKFEQIMRQLFCNNRIKFIEKNYIIALLRNKNLLDLYKVIKNSHFVRDELKEEVEYCLKNNFIDNLYVLGNISINNLREALRLTKNLKNKEFGKIYEIYINYLLGSKLNIKDIEYNNTSIFSPILNYIKISKETTEYYEYYLSDLFDLVSESVINELIKNGIQIKGKIRDKLNKITEGYTIQDILEKQKYKKIRVLVPYDINYVNQIKTLAQYGLKDCYVFLDSNNQLKLIYIDENLMLHLKNEEYKRTITINKFNAADGNTHALIKYMPIEYRKKYKINLITGKDVWNIENIVKVPLISLVTISGFSTFLYFYPKLTYNIELGHGNVILKACGLMDKTDKNSGGNPKIYENVDYVCVSSHFNMIQLSSFYAIPENKFRITGSPRTDLLILEDARSNLERLLGLKLKNKKVIFNLPTFHIFEAVNRIEGLPEINDAIKLPHFDYELFDEFLEKNDLICVSKVHHGEEVKITEKVKYRKFKNIYFFNNEDLERFNINLYEILGAGDILITDYSSVYGDYLFMNKPIIFVNYDIEEYRKNRGLALEPYDFWTAGPKVSNQNDLHKEIINYINNPNYYKEEREKFQKLFFKYIDDRSTDRVWKMIDEIFEKIIT
ncbi:CDP-glycerol glycerophosphotransferase, TagB/SpsB family [Caloramator fervidus]|uniref:CDP-glycerol glycerophosphotransferase, TagB/SpsB family n=1 Tax=Caloramator fervidus TaxID=29344 RepID=A0A1H5WJP4_9CLOT|nr:CDP-glycerol glycerophosphotransferase family protein [Caloramator fervidus]SEF99585.1 CDP-glycerol glycerophosphotransferase, TagB/SpsB family [Caloramator fervidus]